MANALFLTLGEAGVFLAGFFLALGWWGCFSCAIVISVGGLILTVIGISAELEAREIASMRREP